MNSISEIEESDEIHHNPKKMKLDFSKLKLPNKTLCN